MDQVRIKRKGERNWPFIIHLIMSFLLIFGVLLTICIFTRGLLFTFKHVLIFTACSIPLCILYAYCVEKLGSGLGGILSGWTSKGFTTRETLAAAREIARNRKRNGEFEEARDIIDRVLEKDPDFPEALYLKAQILWEGFESSTEARKYLKKVIQVVPYEETLHRWASSYYDEIIAVEKKRLTHFPSNTE